MGSVVNSWKYRSGVSVAIFSALFLSAVVQASTPVCGDGIAEPPEQCDDGNNKSGDGCSPTCLIEPTCGNRIAEPGEDCDLGNLSNGTKCTSLCKAIITANCGNGVIDPGEGCDPALTPNSCNKDCTFSLCGDGKLGPGEQCDGNNGDVINCNSNCRFSNCPDNHLNTASGEECDPGMETAGCNWNCRASRCGDNITNTLAGEQCDPPGAMPSGDTCSPACKVILAPTSAPSAGSGGLDTGTIIGIVVGVTSLLLAAIPIVLGYRAYAKKKGKWPYAVQVAATVVAAATTPGATKTAANLAANAVVNGGANGP